MPEPTTYYTLIEELVNVKYCKKPIIFQLKLYFILSLANFKLLDDVENICFNKKKKS